MLACEINEEFNRWDTFLVHKLLGDKKKLSILFYTLILLTFTLCPLFSLSLLKHANLTVFLVSTSIFLLFSDLNLFLEVLKYCSLEVILGNCKDAEQNCSFLNHLLSNPLFVQHILSMFLKTSMLILCVTSRYPYILENIFRFTLVEQVTCMYTANKPGRTKYLILDEKLTSSTRRRSYSCSSHHSSYMGRSPVNMHNLATHSMKPNFSDAKQHTVTIILIGLIILHINNHYSDLNGPSESQSSPSELINLDLPSKNDALLTEQLRESSDLLRHSNEMNNIPARSKRRIYCIDKAKDHDAENEPMPTSLSLGTDRKDSEYMSGVLNLDALTSKIKQGLGHELSDMEILKLISNGQLKTRELESVVRNPSRAVELRRLDLSTFLNNSHIIERIPYKDYDYRLVYGQCCEE
ncbi:unnamed protein product [Heterobilharzia americana]|nr:unnamed protein product [Heterobilharzia americana]